MIERNRHTRARRARLALAGAALMLGLAGCGSTPSRAPDTGDAGPAAGPDAAQRPAPAEAPTARRGGGYYKDDGPPDIPPPDLHLVPDALPRAEPLHRFANRPYNVFGRDYVPATERRPFRERGIASWYGRRFHGNPTSSGETYDMYAMTAAHPTLPIPSYVRVTHLGNKRSVVVRVNDRGPFHADRIIDLSYTAAYRLGYINTGSALVEVEAILPGEAGDAIAVAPVPAMSVAATLPVVPAEPLVTAAAAPLPPPAPPAPVAPSADPAPQAAPERGVFLQLGAFSSAANAENFLGTVRERLATSADRLEVSAEGGRFRLHLGPFASVDEARAEAERVAAVLKLRPFIVSR